MFVLFVSLFLTVSINIDERPCKKVSISPSYLEPPEVADLEEEAARHLVETAARGEPGQPFVPLLLLQSRANGDMYRFSRSGTCPGSVPDLWEEAGQWAV